jgi:hypothetical protein
MSEVGSWWAQKASKVGMDDSTMVMSWDLRICSRIWRTHEAKSGRSLGVFSMRAVRICRVTWTLLSEPSS